jgi:hypothetical protein
MGLTALTRDAGLFDLLARLAAALGNAGTTVDSGVGTGDGGHRPPGSDMARRTYDYDPEAYREVVKSADLPWRWTELTRREDWPPRSREPAPDMTPMEREQFDQFWQDVDRATDVIELVNTPAHERDPYQVPDEYSNDRLLFDRLEARRAAEDSIERFRNKHALYDRDEAYQRIAYDKDMGVLREWQELERRLRRRMYPGEGQPEPTDWREVQAGMNAFHDKLLELRMLEENNRRERERLAEWSRQQREYELDRPAPGPDGDLVAQRELDEAQDRMTADMERPADDREVGRQRPQLDWIAAARAEVERQYGPDLSEAHAEADQDERRRGEHEQEWEEDRERGF